MADSTLVSSRNIEFGQLCRLITPFDNVFLDADITKQGAEALAERFDFSRLCLNGIAQDLAHFLFGAPTVLSRTLLELRLHVVVEVANHQLSHDAMHLPI